MQREVRADRVSLEPRPDNAQDEGANGVRIAIDERSDLVVRWNGPVDLEPALRRRLEMLVASFRDVVLESSGERGSRPPIATSLRDELRALAQRARAHEALVIDADSPVIWGTSEYGPPSDLTQDESGVELPVDTDDAPPLSEHDPSTRAVSELRALPSLSSLRKGRRLHYVTRDETFGILAHSFAGIYILVVVFDGVFDELRAERATSEALPRIERLVMALPPRDPTPEPRAGAISLRRSPRR